jgi:dTDP-4-amino-4,6-dideoxygalactose transaminase
MKDNIILDVDLVLDLLANRSPHSHAAEQAFKKALSSDCRIWLVAACLPTLLERLEEAFQADACDAAREADREATSSKARDVLRAFLKKVSVLSSHGFDAERAFASEHPLCALVLCAADAFADDVEILSQDPDLLHIDKRVVDPQTFAKRDDAASQPTGMIPLVDLVKQQHRILPEIEKGITNVLRHGQYIMGPEIRALEEKLAEYTDVEHVVCCSSGTDALLMALMAYDVGPGDAIFTPSFTFISTAEVVSLLGATPVFVDIDPRTFNMDPECLERAILACKENNSAVYPLPALPGKPNATLDPKGIIPVDLFGLPAEYDRINTIARKHRLFVIEDAAQSFGADYHGKRACSLADIGCTSFFPAKPLGGYGDGGAVLTRDADLIEKMTSIRIHGKGRDKYDNARIGLNARMDTLQAALLLPKLEIFTEEIRARNRVAHRYTELLSPHKSLQTPYIPEGLRSAWAQYSLLTDRRGDIQSALKAKGIPTAVYYPKPLHLQTAFARLGYKEGDFPASESAARRVVSLPMHPYLTNRQIAMIATEVEAVLTA